MVHQMVTMVKLQLLCVGVIEMQQETKDAVRAIYQRLVQHKGTVSFCSWIYLNYNEAFYKPSPLEFPQGMKYKKE